MAEAVTLSLEALVTLEHDVEPYVMDWPDVLSDDGEPEAAVLIVSKRPGGFLAAVPVGFLPEEVLANGNADSPPGLVGPSTVLRVQGKVMDHGTLAPTGALLTVVVVDLDEGVVNSLRTVGQEEVYPFTFDPDQPFAIPDPPQLLTMVRDWLSANASSTQAAYLSLAEEEAVDLEDVPLEEDRSVNTPPPRRARKAAPGPERASNSGKRPTVATLASSMDQLLQMNAGFSKNLEALTLRQLDLERKMSAPAVLQQGPHAVLHRPISDSLVPQGTAPKSIAHQLGSPPRTLAPSAPGLLSSQMFKPQDLAELEVDKREGGPPTSSDPLAQAVLAQSQALTALVAQIAQTNGDPMLELGSAGLSTGTRGAQGRARLQAELAAQKGSFFASVISSMSRRMFPTMTAEGSYQELMDRGVCGTRYLERFGGYGKVRDLGCLQYQVMTILDSLQTSNLQAARDQAALLAVTLDQAAMDQGRFDLAHLLCLQEEPPAAVFTNRQASMLAKSRAFSPLADQKWVTVALAYLKELDVITSKRLELTNQSKPGQFASSSSADGPAQPKQKAQPKRKSKAGGKGNQPVATDAEE